MDARVIFNAGKRPTGEPAAALPRTLDVCPDVAEIIMFIFSKLLAVRNGAQSFPQPLRSASLLTFALILLFSPHSLHAQTGGRIAGAVTDASGAVIPNSQVLLLDPSTGVKQNTTTGGDGVFTF